MTAEEKQIWDMVHKFCDDLLIEIPDMNRRYLMDKINEYASQQRTEAWNSAIDAAAESAYIADDGEHIVSKQSILKLKR